MTLCATNLTLRYGTREVAHIPGLQVEDGHITCLIGPNGCGKSTLLKALAGLLKPATGQVMLDGKPLPCWRPRVLARRLATLPQTPTAPDGIRVHQLVAHGRYPHQGLFSPLSHHDRDVIRWALNATGVHHLRERTFNTLSGGERQRVWLAMVLAQQADILLLDEPTTFLDIGHQIELLDLLAELQSTRQFTIIMVLHDLNQACQYADHLLAIHAGRIIAQGKPCDIVNSALTETLFNLMTDRVDRQLNGKQVPYCLPLRSLRPSGTIHESVETTP